MSQSYSRAEIGPLRTVEEQVSGSSSDEGVSTSLKPAPQLRCKHRRQLRLLWGASNLFRTLPSSPHTLLAGLKGWRSQKWFCKLRLVVVVVCDGLLFWVSYSSFAHVTRLVSVQFTSILNVLHRCFECIQQVFEKGEYICP